MNRCSVQGCENPYRSKGFCSAHYQAWRKYGTPTPRALTPAERFWAKVDTSGECWLWTGARRPTGYGNLRRDGITFAAHRYAYMLAKGPIPDGLVLDHLCRNPSCVNPDHLEAVTNRENVMRGEQRNVVSSRANRCKRGHDWTGNGAYVHPRWGRACRECRRLRRAGAL